MRPPGRPASARRGDLMRRLTLARPARLDAGHPPAVRWPDPVAFTGPGAPGQLRRGQPRSGQFRQRMLAAASSAAALLAVIGGLVAVGPAAPRGGTPARRDSHPAGSPPHLTARQVLIEAADHVRPAAGDGRYWFASTISGLIVAGGTRAHPYDIVMPSLEMLWLSPRSGRTDYSFGEELGATPATPADRAPWRAAGSPRTWYYGIGGVTTAGPTQVAAFRWTGHGLVGYLEGDLSYLTRTQFLALPASPSRLLRALRREARQLPSVRNPREGGATESQVVWGELVQLLHGPVSWRVRRAAWEILAGFGGMRSLGPMRDPRGRAGFGIAGGPGANGQILVVNPADGALLATEDVGTPAGLPPGPVPRSLIYRGRPCQGGHPVFVTVGSRRERRCVPVYFHRVYRGQVYYWTAYLAGHWTDSAPHLAARPTWVAGPGY